MVVAGTIGEIYKRYGVPYALPYHTTPEINLKSVMVIGLIPQSQPALFKGIGEKYVPTRRGIYLAPKIKMIDDLLKDYDTRENRIPGTFSLLQVNLPEWWLVAEDPQTSLMGYKPPALLTIQVIPARLITIVKRDYCTISKIVPGQYKTQPGNYAGYGDSVRQLSTGRVGEVVGVVELSSTNYVLKIQFVGSPNIETVNAKDLVVLYL